MEPNIKAGEKSQIKWADGNWVFIDIGFAHQAPSCGLIIEGASPEEVQFACATGMIVRRFKESESTMNLVIEAPLSICFDSTGNPKRRRIEKEGSKTRYWYNQAGCMVLVAAMYLIRAIHEAKGDVSIRLFEGFVSFKERSLPSNDARDVCALREIVRNPKKFSDSIYGPDELREDPSDMLTSAFCVAGLDCGVPAVIKPGSRC
jgi:hypothetical protein